MIAYDKRGAVFAMREGAELLVHDGESEGPLWRKTLDATIVGLAADSTQVVAVTASGTVTWFDATSGTERRVDLLGEPVTIALADVATQRVVAVSATRILALAGASAATLVDHTARAIAMRPDGTVLAATDSGLVTIALDGSHTTAPYAGEPIRALAWHPEGFWVLGATSKLLRWDGSGEPSHITSLPTGAQVDHVACSARAVAVSWNHHQVVTFAWPSKETLGSLDYIERKVEGLDFGPWPWLGVGLDLGDGNKHNLDAPERLHRTDTHPGREHHSWLVSVGGGPEPAEKLAPATPATLPKGPSGGRLTGIILALIVAIVVFYLLRR